MCTLTVDLSLVCVLYMQYQSKSWFDSRGGLKLEGISPRHGSVWKPNYFLLSLYLSFMLYTVVFFTWKCATNIWGSIRRWAKDVVRSRSRLVVNYVQCMRANKAEASLGQPLLLLSQLWHHYSGVFIYFTQRYSPLAYSLYYLLPKRYSIPII